MVQGFPQAGQPFLRFPGHCMWPGHGLPATIPPRPGAAPTAVSADMPLAQAPQMTKTSVSNLPKALQLLQAKKPTAPSDLEEPEILICDIGER